MRRGKLLIALCLCAVAWAGGPALAQAPNQGLLRIAAVVNDEVITLHDLQERLRLAIVSSGIPNSEELIHRLTPQVLRSVIDEKLQMQEAKRMNLAAAPAEIDAAIGSIEKNNKLPAGGLLQVLKQNGVNPDALKDQIRANVLWGKVINMRLRPTIKIGEDEVDEALERLKANLGLPESLVAEIFLSVDSPDQDADVLRTAERIVEQARQGAAFSALAGQFSQSATAASGGDLGWLKQGELAEELEAGLAKMEPPSLSPPIRSVSGYHLLFLRDRRAAAGAATEDTTVIMRRLLLPVSTTAAPAEVNEQARKVVTAANTAQSCADMDRLAGEIHSPVPADLGSLRVGDLPPDTRRIAMDFPLNKASPPIRSESGIYVLMVCERNVNNTLPSRAQISEGLQRQRLELLARRSLRDLRRNAFIDLRL